MTRTWRAVVGARERRFVGLALDPSSSARTRRLPQQVEHALEPRQARAARPRAGSRRRPRPPPRGAAGSGRPARRAPSSSTAARGSAGSASGPGLPVVDRAPPARRRRPPRTVAEVEREPEPRVERPEQQREHAVVARGLDDEPDRAEPVAEQRARAPRTTSSRPEPDAGHLDREREPVRHRRGPARELLLGGQPVAGHVQLDRRRGAPSRAGGSPPAARPAG